MASLPPPTPQSALIGPHLAPLLYNYSTPDLLPILARSSFSSVAHLLEAFQGGVEKVGVRSVNYEQRMLARFPVKFVERTLPAGWGEERTGRGRSGTLGAHSAAGTPQRHAPPTPSTPFNVPTPAERDELFLDSLSSSLPARVDSWLQQTGREELNVQGVKLKRRLAVDGEENVPEEEAEQDEGWKGRTIENLTPWYAAVRDEVFRRREMVEWETFGWPVGCVLALSTSHPDPLNALASLWDLTSPTSLFSSTAAAAPPGSPSPNAPSAAPTPSEYANPDVLRYILLVHDLSPPSSAQQGSEDRPNAVQERWEDAQTLHETIRKTYGIHTALVPVFGAGAGAGAKALPRAMGAAALWPTPAPSRVAAGRPVVGLGVSNDDEDDSDPFMATPVRVQSPKPELGQDLSEEDLKALRVFMRELVVQSVVPWIERQVVVGHEAYNASKKSIGGRLFSAGRKYFGGGSSDNSRAGSPANAGPGENGYNAQRACYPFSSNPSQHRRLADLTFTLGDYKLASSIYESVAKDFRTDRAWRYWQAAVRMQGLSLLLAHPAGQSLPFNPDTYLSSASSSPLALANAQAGVVDLDGLKMMMMYYETYRVIGDWRAASMGLERTAGEIDEVSSALLLEQAAISDLYLPKSSKRKYAFHMAMAASRYEKSGLKSLSRRCLSQAATLYRTAPTHQATALSDPRLPSAGLSSWSAVRSHLHHGLGRQAYNVGKADDAVEHFLELLKGKGLHSAADSDVGEEDWLDDFGLAWEHLGPSAAQVIAERNLSLPVVIFSAADAHVRITQAGNVTAQEAEGSEWREMEEEFARHQGTRGLREGKKETNEAIIGETFYLELQAVNPLDAALAIGGLQVETDTEPGHVDIDAPQEIELAPRQSLRVYVPVRATSLLSFSFTKLKFRFNDLLPCTESLASTTKDQQSSPTAAGDLTVKVRSPVPNISVGFEDLPDTLWAGEGRMASLSLTNTGQIALVGLGALCREPTMGIFTETRDDPYSSTQSSGSSAGSSAGSDVPNCLLPNTPTLIKLKDAALQPGESVKLPVFCRGDSVGHHTLRWLFTFNAQNDAELLMSRAAHRLHVRPSLDLRPFVRSSNLPSAPHVLGVEIHNASIPSDIIITQISSLSPRWKCALSPGFDFAKDVAPLGWQQSLNLFLTVEPAGDAGGAMGLEEGAEFAVKQLDSLLQGKDVTASLPGDIVLQRSTIASTAPVDLSSSTSTISNSLLRTHIALRHLNLTSQLPTIPKALHQHLFPLFNPRSLDLAVFWTIPSTGERGHHHLADIPLGAGHNRLKEVLETAELKAGGLYAESQRERSTLLAGLRRSEFGVDEPPARISFVVDEILEHDFSRGPCSVPVTISIRNLSPTLPFDYTLVLQDLTKPASPDIVFAGSITHRGSVAPLALNTISTSLWITRQGTHNIGGWSLAVSRDDVQWTENGRRREIRVTDARRTAARSAEAAPRVAIEA